MVLEFKSFGFMLTAKDTKVLYGNVVGGVNGTIQEMYSYLVTIQVCSYCFYEYGCNICVTSMWANAQRDGRTAEYRWCPVFNAAKLDDAHY